jgi:hypothetical protein
MDLLLMGSDSIQALLSHLDIGSRRGPPTPLLNRAKVGLLLPSLLWSQPDRSDAAFITNFPNCSP